LGHIKLYEEDAEVFVTVRDREIEILDISDEHVIGQCDLQGLDGATGAEFPDRLVLEVHDSDGFGTYFFHELSISKIDEGILLDFRCHTPNKYWEGRFGLATFIEAINKQVGYHDNLAVQGFEIEDDWKGITLRRIVSATDPIAECVKATASELMELLHASEVALGGFLWKPEYQSDEDLFCRELLKPLLQRIGFLFVRYTHGKKEYGKDFIFSEMTPFGNHRHYGLQAKAGSISGRVNSDIDELLGQIKDAFEMPFYPLGSKEPCYISTFIIAISGSFTENAKEKIAEKISKGLTGSIYFFDREMLEGLIECFWNKGA